MHIHENEYLLVKMIVSLVSAARTMRSRTVTHSLRAEHGSSPVSHKQHEQRDHARSEKNLYPKPVQPEVTHTHADPYPERVKV